MATEEAKKKNMMRLMTLMIGGMAKALYDLFGETAFATMTEVGKSLLTIMEDEMGLEIDSENPKDVIMEVGRIFIGRVVATTITLLGFGKFRHLKPANIRESGRKALLMAPCAKPLIILS